ncbi:MAG: hypothetical protein HYY50_05180 [Candidatus Kerfeldbacteria bacterium]|nr:hypothetical protein [Candidatus Kerfeldbacteria bacterium]
MKSEPAGENQDAQSELKEAVSAYGSMTLAANVLRVYPGFGTFCRQTLYRWLIADQLSERQRYTVKRAVAILKAQVDKAPSGQAGDVHEERLSRILALTAELHKEARMALQEIRARRNVEKK